MTTQRVHWFSSMGVVVVEETDTRPSLSTMQEFLKGYVEHISVLYGGKRCAMWVHEEGRFLWEVRNEPATEIYFAMSRSQGIDPENPAQAEEQLLAYAKSMGVPSENIIRFPDDGKQVGIYGPAILLEGFPDE